jgi:hypothetical protein
MAVKGPKPRIFRIEGQPLHGGREVPIRYLGGAGEAFAVDLGHLTVGRILTP